MVSLTPVGSSDIASYAAYGRITSLGGNPYAISPVKFLGHHSAYTQVVGVVWRGQRSVYGPIATAFQSFAASIGGPNVATTIWVLMILNGAVFIGVGYLLLRTSDDPVRATLFWAANPVIIQQLVGGGQIDTFVAAGAICAIQVARRVSGVWGDVLVGVLIGAACGIKINAVLIGIGLAWPLLRRHEWLRVTRMTAVALAVFVLEYSFYGLGAPRSMLAGLKWVIMPSPWRLLQMAAEALGARQATTTMIISILWPVAMFVLAWFIYQRISSDQPREIVAPFALTFAWVIVAPWVFAWYTAIAWASLTLVPRNRMTRWLTIVTVLLALWHSNGGGNAPAR
jgi:Glycosyltransferase family 87